MKQYIYIFFIFLMFVVGAYAQDKHPQVSATISPDTIMIGDRFKVRVEVDKDMAQVIDFPRFDKKSEIDTFEIVSVSGVDTVKNEGRRQKIAIEYIMTCFDAGKYVIGNFPVLYIDKNIVDTLVSKESLSIVVNTFEIDTTKQQILDIKPPLETPLQFSEIKNYVYWTVAVLILLAFIAWLIIKYKRKASIFSAKSVEPPHLTAIKELEKLYLMKLWQNGNHKQYYTSLTDIIRNYIHGRYGITAVEMTSDEILHHLRSISLKDVDVQRMQKLFNIADLVKFAKLTPDIQENEDCYNAAYYFVEDTKLLPQQEVELERSNSEKKD